MYWQSLVRNWKSFGAYHGEFIFVSRYAVRCLWDEHRVLSIHIVPSSHPTLEHETTHNASSQNYIDGYQRIKVLSVWNIAQPLRVLIQLLWYQKAQIVLLSKWLWRATSIHNPRRLLHQIGQGASTTIIIWNIRSPPNEYGLNQNKMEETCHSLLETVGA